MRKGEVGSHRYELPQALIEALDQIWHEEIEAKLGFPTYQALCAAIDDRRRTTVVGRRHYTQN